MNVMMLFLMNVMATVSPEMAASGTADVVPIDDFWDQITLLTWLHAVIAISVGVVYMLYGWRIFRVLVVICFGLAGMFLGIFAGQRLVFMNEMWGGIIGLIVFAAVAIPLMKWCVSVLGAAAGGIITGGIWYGCGLPQTYLWAGVVIGVVAGGLISFILLKAAVMLFTSLSGSALLVIGFLSLLYQYENTQTPPTSHIYDLVHLEKYQWFLPAALIVPTLIGMMIQNKFIKHSAKWEMK